jgi:uncharacterized protein YjbI with pentapeptide repeats
MADNELLALLKQGVGVWNGWKQQNEDVIPNLTGANLSRANLGGADLEGADLEGADLEGADLEGADLHGADLEGADLSGANLNRANFSRANLEGADLHGANLGEADLHGANLNRADLEGANLEGADLHGAHLLGADLNGTHLDGANLSRANLRGADLTKAHLLGANLSRANLSRANLGGADLTGAKLTKAILYETVFGNTNLREVQGLDTCQHEGPSILDYRTLSRLGPLPLPFLRGCGLPDQFIEYLPSLLNQAIQFYSCFISYSTKDQEFAERLHADLQNRGVRCWFAPHDIQSGKKIHEQIDEAIRLYDRLLLILSNHSMNSRWVKTEIAHARQKELKEKRKVLFPIGLVPFKEIQPWKLFDAEMGDDSANEIREYFIPDFSDWKNHNSYQIEFERLLKSLKAEEQRTAVISQT